MIRIVSPWSPAFVRELPRTMGQLVPLVPPAQPATISSVAKGVGTAAVVLAVSSIGVLFTYGLARDAKSKLVKTTGYILAGAGALIAVGEALGLGALVTKSQA